MPHFERLYNFACWLTHDRQEAEDLVQETYAKALRGFPSFQPGTNFRAWIYKILRNAFLTSRTGLKATTTVSLDLEDEVGALPAVEETPESLPGLVSNPHWHFRVRSFAHPPELARYYELVRQVFGFDASCLAGQLTSPESQEKSEKRPLGTKLRIARILPYLLQSWSSQDYIRSVLDPLIQAESWFSPQQDFQRVYRSS